MRTNGLRQLRQSKGLGLRDVAETSGVSPSAISLIERGIQEPKMKTIRRLASGYGVDEETVLEMLGIRQRDQHDLRLVVFEGASDAELAILEGVLRTLRAHGVG